jgi:GT2 family glycosyltransferase
LETAENVKMLQAIVLGYRNFRTTTQLCLESLLNSLDRTDFKLTVIDNGSSDDAGFLQQEFVKSYPSIESLVLSDNLGYAGGMNYAAKTTNAKWLLLLGSDTILSRGTIDTLCELLPTLDARIGIVSPVTNEAGNCQGLGFSSQDSKSVFSEYAKQAKLPKTIILPIYRADFFCVAIRKSLWDQLNGLDLSYGRGYYEDFDFCMRAKSLGYTTVMIENIFVYHAGSASFKNDRNQKKLIKNNKKIFIQKFPHAELRHRRLDHLKLLEQYIQSTSQRFELKAIQERVIWRLKVIREDQPRRFWKKILWNMKVNKIEKMVKQKMTIN